MCRKSVYLTSFVLVLCVTAGVANAYLVAYWPMDEGSGTTVSDATGTWNGTITGNVTWVDGKEGMALEFPGGQNYVNCGNVEIGSDLTLAYWCFNPEKTFERSIGQHSGNYTTDPGWCVYSRNEGEGTVWFRVHGADNAWDGGDIIIPDILPKTEWYHLTFTFDGTTRELKGYLNGELKVSKICEAGRSISPNTNDLRMGHVGTGEPFVGMLDEVAVWNHVLTEDEILAVMEGHIGGANPFAFRPDPDDGALHTDTWVTLSWKPGAYTVSHDVYMGDNFDDVNNATRDTDVFRGSQPLGTDFYIAGFFGYAYPDGLVNGTTYYWRIDEVNEVEPNSPWKGDVWSFSIPPKTAYEPDPADSAEFVDLNVVLSWTPGFGAKLHYVVFGEDFDEVNNAAAGVLSGSANYSPGPLKLAKTYYWRVDESDGFETFKGRVWSFTTTGAVSGPNPTDGAVDVNPAQILTWNAGAVAASHEVYFGSDPDAVKNATKSSPEYKGTKALGEESYDPDKLSLETTYYWRIDEVNGVNPDSPWAGNVWSFTTGDYFVIDDFEDYDAGENQIWYAWHDGLGYGTPGTANYFAGNGTGAAVGDETTPSYTEEIIVQGGNQSMPLTYDNNKQGSAMYSEVEHTLTDQRDWTEEGVTELSLWFRGYSGSVGSFVEGPIGTFTMTGSGADIWNVNGVEADQFHFAYKMITGAGSIIAKVDSVENTNGWAKAGVMIRESLNPDSAHAFACVTPNNGVASQGRPSTGGASFNTNQTGITAPHWVKLERSISGLFTVSHSADGASWQQVTGAIAENIAMGSNVYIGLALTSHDAGLTCQAVFSNVKTTGNVTGQWTNQDIGIASNDAEPLYVAVSNSTGAPAVVVHNDPAAANINTWTEWVIPLSAFADQGVVLTDVDRIAIGLGTRGNMTIPGGSGKMYIDNIRLYQPREAAE